MNKPTTDEGGTSDGEAGAQHEGGDAPTPRGARNSVSSGIVDSSMLMVIKKALEEVTSMSPRERNRILEAIHGVGDVENDERTVDTGIYFEAEESSRSHLASVMASHSSSNKPSPSPPYEEENLPSWEDHLLLTSSTNRDVTVAIDSKARSTGESDIVGESASHHQHGKGEQSFAYDDDHSSSSATTADNQVEQRLPQPPTLPPLSSLAPDGGAFITEKLNELDEAIDHIQHKAAYNQAQQNADGYVEDPKFRLVFLRANSYDARKAATRLVSFMEEKLQRFGPEALTRQLTMDDLSRTSRSLLVKRGVMQILPTRDSTGRAILVTYFQFVRLQDELRRLPACLGDLIFYLLSVMAEDQETQRRGIVTVGVIVSPSWGETELAVKLLHCSLKDLGASIDRWCPVKCNAHHHWIYANAVMTRQSEDQDDPPRPIADSASITSGSKQEPEPANEGGEHIESGKSVGKMTASTSGQIILDTIMGCMGREYRIRTRMHKGLFGEYKEILKTFGIAGNRLPFTMDGSEIRVSGAHMKWIQKRREKEGALILHRLPRRRKATGGTSGKPSAGGSVSPLVKPKRGAASKINAKCIPSCFDVIDIPGRHDVCLGKGMGLHQHSGNIAMRAMMEPLLKEYDSATSTRRQELNKLIIQAIHLIGGRFLTNRESPEGAWFTVELDDSFVEKSIGGIFRSMVSRKTRNHVQNEASSQQPAA